MMLYRITSCIMYHDKYNSEEEEEEENEDGAC